MKTSQGDPGESQPKASTDDAEVRADIWWIQGDFIHRHLNECRVSRYVSKEEVSPILLNHIEMTKPTHNDFDIMEDQQAFKTSHQMDSDMWQNDWQN